MRQSEDRAGDMNEGGSRTILVVEDDPGVRDLILTTLLDRGFAGVAAADGREAMMLIEADSQVIDLLVSDVVMPGIGGLELVELARARRPGLPVVLISGYNPKLLPSDSFDSDVTFLEKPFTALQLTGAILDALRRVEAS
jgi:two-component system cell cycle sensor histidine kinase/response regulator CckA